MKMIEGGVCAPYGFKAYGMHCGVKSNNPDKKDVAVIASEIECTAAAMFTKNVVQAAPIHVTREHLKDGRARAILVNSGNANACAPHGERYAQECCRALAELMQIPETEIVVASTGVIGQTLPKQVIIDNLPTIVANLNDRGSEDAALAIMTTDTVKKEFAVEFTLSGQRVRIGGIAKGSGMIHPNMGTMLAFLTTDCDISSQMLSEALHEAVAVSFNRISVDGDTSTNDTCCILANGIARNLRIGSKGEDYRIFTKALTELCTRLARSMAKDGEGAKHLITCTVQGAASEEDAETVSKSVISSTLTKAAIFGCDANWGRILCAMGYSGVAFDPEQVNVAFASEAGVIDVCRQGRGLDFDEALAKKILTEPEVEILVSMGEGEGQCTCWGCDITYDYIKINGDYRT